ncbi:uncharacterized protein LOC119177774 isoform X2 [Rhipicephalus microplus]|uniref:uncharacterized protein LOC119177774 isoform X2 n=2 Tax=Rhipicephalus microplus TaxID=6941 RepID=UPI003F6D9790
MVVSRLEQAPVQKSNSRKRNSAGFRMAWRCLVASIVALVASSCQANTNVLRASCLWNESPEKESSVQVDCSRKGLTIVPAGSVWPRNIYKMDLSHNFIDHITHLEPSNVSVLDLHDNRIAIVEPRVFSAFPRLQFLDLSKNSLEVLHGDVFVNMTSLRALNLSGNKLTYPPTELFRPLVSLEQLNLNMNPLRYLRDGLFRLPNLERLELSSINAHSLPDGIFHETPRLVHLDLSGNLFDKVPSSALRSADGLKVLVMSDNPVGTLGYNSFFKLHNIEELYVEKMKDLEAVEGDTFAYQKKMRSLFLGNNPKLKSIDLDIFGVFWRVEPAANWTLREFYLQNNNIEYLDEDVAPWREFEILDLQGNPWVCDCNNAWIRRLPLQKELTVQLGCGGPPAYEHKPMLEVPDEVFACPSLRVEREQSSTFRTGVLVVGALSISAILLSAILLIKRKNLYQRFMSRKNRNGSVYYVKAHTNPVDGFDPSA